MKTKEELRADLERAEKLVADVRAQLAVAPEPVRFTCSKPHWADTMEHDAYGTVATFTESGIGFRFRWIPPGTDTLGSSPAEQYRYDDETQCEFTTSGFWLGETTVTAAQWAAAMQTDKPAKPEHPQVNITYFDVLKFCAELSAKRDVLIEPPTEWEWEYAARAGTDGPTYGPLDEIAVYNTSEVAPVKTKKPNLFGLYDMIGNVWEWTSSTYEK